MACSAEKRAALENSINMMREYLEDLDRRIAKHLTPPGYFDEWPSEMRREWLAERGKEIAPMRLQREAIAKRIADAHALLWPGPSIRIDGPDHAA